VRWSDRILAIALVLLTWHGAATLREAFAAAREAVVAMYPTRRRPGVHLEGFLKGWQKRSASLLKRIVAALRERTVRQSGEQWRWKKLTNVHDEASLSDSEVAALYRQRWTIEVMFRSLKQTLGKRAMRCETPALARYELDWCDYFGWHGLASPKPVCVSGKNVPARTGRGSLRERNAEETPAACHCSAGRVSSGITRRQHY